ncbi:MAG: 2-deoxy-D-gluconate 3-dehydrogenase [Armatimonadetes bacterium CG2_30_59_28]|nr:glucose 1-dehydrogenase [Armatimonadota bacterium]OIO98118.1 MAG: 2-deoxy-D-gluconate 3-dehydrogenase [Armatimonadetes bacterium CG2_30_59_28]PIU63593.1 MAG: 2-deoxy-D-gluconate 3-dehydrogenase [Armatimonadetes bacterium CG07_land_8_20_14_0_80_59_28]PIY42419.1 MAG: 2-deoxy-D-gluconate 3-dehydrogenase [Armatimonadetes bacterium CG_4_10_14_3_um_filter_59_10]
MIRLDARTLFDLSGRVAVVTGASRGLGFAMAEGLASAGADVVITSSASPLDEIAARVNALGRRAVAVHADLGQEDAAAKIIDATVSAFGKIDILVNNAGICPRRIAEEHSLDDWYRTVEINLSAVFRLCQAAGRVMLERGYGKIINIGSLMTFQGGYTIPGYAATKHGIAGLTKSLANDWGSRGITVNAIAPGYMETELALPLQQDPVRGPQIEARIPAGRWGKPEELVGAAVFLASEASTYVNGHVLVVDGGWMGR